MPEPEEEFVEGETSPDSIPKPPENDLKTPVERFATPGFTVADVMTLGGYGLGLWWCAGGPDWAALASIGLDELDGVVAGQLEGDSMCGRTLDWGADIALTPMALLRLSKDLERPEIATIGAPVVLALQAKFKSMGRAPPVLSARAVVMLAAILLESKRRKGGTPRTRENPARDRRRGRKERR